MEEIDAWLRSGNRVVAASDRAARAILADYHRARRAEGASAWTSPDVLSWQNFVQQEWLQRSADERLILNGVQEQSLWSQIIGASGNSAALLAGPRRRLASLSMQAHSLLANYAPQFLNRTTRRNWQQDAGAFSTWLEEFNATCRAGKLLSADRINGELTALLTADKKTRAPILLAGFDRITPAQQHLLDTWGTHHTPTPHAPASDVRAYTAGNTQSELAACAAWCSQQLRTNSRARLLIITQDAATLRGELERALLQAANDTSHLRFEFSLGVPLSNVAITRTAITLLQWLSSPLAEHEIDWLFSTPYIGSARETSALQAYHRALRHRSLQRTQWTLRKFLHQPIKTTSLLAPWTERMAAAQNLLNDANKRPHSPIEWAELVSKLLEAAGWPGTQTPSSAEFQAARRWQQCVDTCASLGFDGRRTHWQDFFEDLRNTAEETLFAPESEEAPVLIAGPSESAGTAADGIWFLAADEDSWPARGSLHPLLPIEVQRSAQMPHVTAQLDWDLAHAVTTRILASAPIVRFSHARLKDGIETRSSRLIEKLVGQPTQLPADLTQQRSPSLQTQLIADASQIPLHAAATENEVRGGSTILTAQSQCPFQAFAKGRLSAESWNPAQAGLTPAVRGLLLHAVLSAIWGGPNGIRTSDDLHRITNLSAFVQSHVQRTMDEKLSSSARETLPPRYIELEVQRLTNLITDWLTYEATRISFSVLFTEFATPVTIAGLTLSVRLDRIDKLNDDSALVIDYKTGDISTKLWQLPRPEDVQLPLYAGFALPEDRPIGGFAFAKLRAGDIGFAGCIGDAANTLLLGLTNRSPLIKNPLTAEQLMDWRETIEQLANDYLAGKADVDPRDPPTTCKACGLQTICRIHERDGVLADADETDSSDE